MARLLFCDYHNIVIILEKGEHNVDFHLVVDFIKASLLRYALTVKPTVYVFHIRQFWSTARIETTEEGTKILATVDGIVRTVSESSLRRNLKLRDEEGISSLPDTKLFENLTLMGYNISPNQKFTFQKVPFHTRKLFTTLRVNSPSFSGRIVPLFDTMLVQQGEGSGTPTESHHTPSPEALSPSHTTHTSPSLPSHTTTSIPTVTPTETTPIRQYTRRARIARSFALLTVADEPASPQRDVSQGEACPTDSGFIADHDRATIAKSSTLPYDSAPRVTSPAAVEGTQEVEINRLKAKVKLLEERERLASKSSRDDASIKGKSMDEGEAATKRVSDDTEEMATVLTSMDASTVLASGVVDVPTGSGSIPTASIIAEGSVPTGSEEVPTASPVFAFATATMVTPVTRTKGKEVMVESETPKKQKIARDVEVARIYVEEELQSMIDGLNSNNETIAKYLQEYHQFSSELPIERIVELISDLVKNNLGWKVKDFRGMTFEEVEAKFNSVWKQIEDFIPIGSKVEAEKIKRKGLNLEQESAKKQKTSEEVPEKAMSPEEVTEENVKEMMQLVPIEEVYVEALQVKHLIIDWKETLSNRPPTSKKEMELWVELNRMYEPDKEDQLWTHTQNFMHASVDWKLYDSCGVHHVTSEDKEIFMLVEKDYPLRKGLALVMICYKLQVENFSQMVNDLILKIYKIVNSPRQQGIPTASYRVPTGRTTSHFQYRKMPLLKEKRSHCQEDRTAINVKKKLPVKGGSYA
nr:hypothetical protein [Tanacetum cinerariifolium]